MLRSRRRLSWQCCAWGRTDIVPEGGSPPPVHGARTVAATSRPVWRQLLPGLLVSLVSLIVVFLIADPARLAQALRAADLRLVLLNALITLVWLVVRAALWRTLLRGQPTFRQTFFTINEGYLLNNVLPFRLGELARVLLLSRKAHLSFWEVLPTVMIERILDVACAAGLLLVTLPFVVGAAWAREAAVVAGVIVLVGLVGLHLVARFHAPILTLLTHLTRRMPGLQTRVVARLPVFFDGLAALSQLKLFTQAVGLILLNWLVAVGQYAILLRAFYPQAKLLWAAFTLSVAALGVAVPSSPGALGVYEASVVGALSLFRLDPSTALGFALTAHLLNYLITGVLGASGLVQDGMSIGKLYQQLRHPTMENQPAPPVATPTQNSTHPPAG